MAISLISASLEHVLPSLDPDVGQCSAAITVFAHGLHYIYMVGMFDDAGWESALALAAIVIRLAANGGMHLRCLLVDGILYHYLFVSAVFGSMVMWFIIDDWGLALFPSGVWTRGEWALVSFFATYILIHVTSVNAEYETWIPVAGYGIFGVVAACTLVATLRPRLLIRILVLMLLPAVMIETQVSFPGCCTVTWAPKSLQWLVTFLLEQESGSGLPPRCYWLAYWFAVLFVSTIFAPNHHQQLTTITRKWFHLVAVALFWPVTIAAPQFMLFSYAVAMALLMILECIRGDVPWLKQFYVRYVDAAKDDATKPLVSPMTLILGCALPLLAAFSFRNDGLSSKHSQLLSLWGIIVVGIGDAAAAVVGKCYGRHYWGNGSRTVEGSIVFFLSVSFSSLWIVDFASFIRLLPSIVLATLLEAWTMQLDNLVLPLAGILTLRPALTAYDA